MCVGGSAPVASYPDLSPRDTSQELIKSKYALSEENKKRNAEITAAKNRAKSLVNFGSDDGPTGTGVTIAGGTMKASTPTGNYGGMDMSNIA